jgi:pyruvate-formate lyase-activating enzyme
MQIRFATMGKKNKHERNPTKSTEKVWNPKKEKNHKTKRQICNNCFFGALLCLQVLQLIMQIRFATTRKKKKHQRSPKKNAEKVWNPKKEKNHKTKRQICKHCFFGFAFKCSW